MSLDWLDVSDLDFRNLLLLERDQISWFPGWLPEEPLAIALKANPCVAWFLGKKCPEVGPWVEHVLAKSKQLPSPEVVRKAEEEIMTSLNDLLVYAIDPSLYDRLPFLAWDSEELSGLVDFQNDLVVDVGAGTGRLAFVAAQKVARAVFAVEPVENLRRYMRHKALRKGLSNVFPVDGLITAIPFPDQFVDVCMGGHVFGDDPEREQAEMVRVTKRGGMVILCPGNNDKDEGWHDFLVRQGWVWDRFEEPGDGWKRKYWKKV